MKPIIDMTLIRILSLVSLEERWGKASERHEAFKGLSDLVPLHGYIMEEAVGDLKRSMIAMVKDSRLVRFKSESFFGDESLVFAPDIALARRLIEVLGYRPASAKVVGGKYRGQKETRYGVPYRTLNFRFICVSEADYAELTRRLPKLLVTLCWDHEYAIERDMDRTFEEDEAA